ncbi:hypothetical protein [Desulfocastanea catecholica]
MRKQAIVLLIFCILLGGCAASQTKQSAEYPRKANDTSGRKAGPAMQLMEQAEKDLDVNTNVLVTPPGEKQKDVSGQ